jgi:prephenate dehydrogenase
MLVKIAIIGLGQIGASIGLALANHQDQVTTIGYDADGEVNRKAMKMGAVQKAGHDLKSSVKEAGIVILALPLDQIYETMQSIAQDVREEAVVIDTAPVKQAVAAWAMECLPPKRYYVGLTMALNPLLLDETGTGLDSARADLFQNGLAAIAAPSGTAGQAIDLAANFVTMLGARPYFADLAELDGIMATVHTLPALAAVALAETVIGQPGWTDIAKLTGRPFTAGLRPLDGESAPALAEAAQRNRVNTVRVLNEYISALLSLRDEIEKEEETSLHRRLKLIFSGLARWQEERRVDGASSNELLKQEMRTFSDNWRGQLGLGKLLGLHKKKPDND